MAEVDRLGEERRDRRSVPEGRRIAELRPRRGGGGVERRIAARLLHPARFGDQPSGLINEELEEDRAADALLKDGGRISDRRFGVERHRRLAPPRRDRESGREGKGGDLRGARFI